MANLKILYIFTSGNFYSANNQKWFHFIKSQTGLDFSVIIQDCSQEIKDHYTNEFNPDFEVLYFKKLDMLLSSSYLNRFRYIKSIAHEIDNYEPDIIHVQGSFYTYMILPLKFISIKPKIIYNVWGSDYHTIYDRVLKNRIILNWLFKRANLIWTNWYSMADDIRYSFPRYNQKVRAIPWGAEKELFLKPSKEDKKFVREFFNIEYQQFLMIYVRRFSANANQDRLIKAVSRIKSKRNFKLILHNPNKDPEIDDTLHALISASNLQEKVIISHKSLTNRQIAALFSLANLTFSLTSREQFSRTVIEAIMSDTHLLLSDIPSYRYLKNIIGFDVPLVSPEDVTSLSEWITMFMDLPAKKDWSFEKEYIRRQMDFEKNGRKFVSVYEELAETLDR